MVPSKEGLYTQAVMLKWLTPKSNVIGKYLHHCNELNEYARVTRYRQYCPVYVILPHPGTRPTGCDGRGLHVEWLVVDTNSTLSIVEN